MPKNSLTDFHSSFSVQKEIMDLKTQLGEKESELIRLECEMMSSSGPESTTSTSSSSDAEEWQSKYERLSEAHKKLQKNNINLEEKLLKIADRFEDEKNLLNKDLAAQVQSVVEAKLTIQQMHKQNTQLKSDLSVALNILQMKPSSFVSQKLESLPEDLQVRVKMYQSDKSEGDRKRGQKIRVSLPGGDQSEESVSAAILATVLEQRESERKKEQKFCIDIGTQTHRWQFPNTKQLLKHSRVKNILRDDVALLEELLELSQVRKQLMEEKGVFDDSEDASEDDNDEEYSPSDILLATLLQPHPRTSHQKSCNTEYLLESDSLASFDLLGSNPQLSNVCLNPQPSLINSAEHHYESINELNYQQQQHSQLHYQQQQQQHGDESLYSHGQHHQIYSSHPSSVSSILSLTQQASPKTLHRSWSTSSYSAVQTEL